MYGEIQYHHRLKMLSSRMGCRETGELDNFCPAKPSRRRLHGRTAAELSFPRLPQNCRIGRSVTGRVCRSFQWVQQHCISILLLSVCLLERHDILGVRSQIVTLSLQISEDLIHVAIQELMMRCRIAKLKFRVLRFTEDWR